MFYLACIFWANKIMMTTMTTTTTMMAVIHGVRVCILCVGYACQRPWTVPWTSVTLLRTSRASKSVLASNRNTSHITVTSSRYNVYFIHFLLFATLHNIIMILTIQFKILCITPSTNTEHLASQSCDSQRITSRICCCCKFHFVLLYDDCWYLQIND